jgi:hypothetical protein
MKTTLTIAAAFGLAIASGAVAQTAGTPAAATPPSSTPQPMTKPPTTMPPAAPAPMTAPPGTPQPSPVAPSVSTAAQPGMTTTPPDFNTLDIGGVGFVTQQQAAGNPWLGKNFSLCDVNHDGQVSRGEYAACSHQP